MIVGICTQYITQGQSYSLRLKFDNENLAKISKVWFSCSRLNILQEMTLDASNNVYFFGLDWEQTQALPVCSTTFNITAKLAGTGNNRDLCNGVGLEVLKNLNPVPAEE